MSAYIYICLKRDNVLQIPPPVCLWHYTNDRSFSPVSSHKTHFLLADASSQSSSEKLLWNKVIYLSDSALPHLDFNDVFLLYYKIRTQQRASSVTYGCFRGQQDEDICHNLFFTRFISTCTVSKLRTLELTVFTVLLSYSVECIPKSGSFAVH